MGEGVAGVNDAGTQVWLLGGYAGSEPQNPWLHWSQTLYKFMHQWHMSAKCG
jgi:hypothetical protein